MPPFFQVLDVSNNRISKLEGLATLNRLEDLWLNDNRIPSLDDLESALASQKDTLTTIYLDNNPAAAAADYRPRLLAALPHLTQLDADVLTEPGMS
jgi:protein phosphatase 1 regulatory subunit 7